MEGAPSASPAADLSAAAAADTGQPAHPPSLQQQQHVALKRLREGLVDLVTMQERGQRAAKRAELSRPGSGGDGSGDGTNDGSVPGASIMLLDVPQGGRTTSLPLPSQQPNSSSGGGGQPPLPPGHKPRPASHEPTGTHVAAPDSGSATPGGPTGGPAPASGSGGTDGAQLQPPAAEADGRGGGAGGAGGPTGGGSMHHAASLESLVPSSGPALAQMDAGQPLEPDLEPHREHVEPAPSSRLGTLKRDRSPSPSNGTMRQSASSGSLTAGGGRLKRVRSGGQQPGSVPSPLVPPPPLPLASPADDAALPQATDGDGGPDTSGGDGSGGRNGTGSGEGSNLEQLAAAALGVAVTTAAGRKCGEMSVDATSGGNGKSSGDNSSQADSGFHPGAGCHHQQAEARQRAAAAVFAAQHTASCIKQQQAYAQQEQHRQAAVVATAAAAVATALAAAQGGGEAQGAAAADAAAQDGQVPSGNAAVMPPPPPRPAGPATEPEQRDGQAGAAAPAGAAGSEAAAAAAAAVAAAAAGGGPGASVPPWLPLLNPNRLLTAAEHAAATQASGLANARPLLEPISSFYSEARDNFVKQVQDIMSYVAGQQDSARTGRQPSCNTEAVMSACSKAFEIIQSYSAPSVAHPPTPPPALSAAAAAFFGVPPTLLAKAGPQPAVTAAKPALPLPPLPPPQLDPAAAAAVFYSLPPVLQHAAAMQAAATMAPDKAAAAASFYNQMTSAQQGRQLASLPLLPLPSTLAAAPLPAAAFPVPRPAALPAAPAPHSAPPSKKQHKGQLKGQHKGQGRQQARQHAKQPQSPPPALLPVSLPPQLPAHVLPTLQPQQQPHLSSLFLPTSTMAAGAAIAQGGTGGDISSLLAPSVAAALAAPLAPLALVPPSDLPHPTP